MADHPRIAVLIVAAGNSSRLAGDVPKVYRALGDQMVIEHSLSLFCEHPRITQVVVVANPEHESIYAPIKDKWADKAVWFVDGGQTRQESVFNGLDALADNPPDWVLVHDAARPNVSLAVVDGVLSALEDASAAVPAIAVKDTIKREEAGLAAETLPRDALRAVQTPQGFYYAELLAAHISSEGKSYTDDASIMEAAGVPVKLVEGCESNQKLTTPEDWARMSGTSAAAPQSETAQWEFRAGQGYDVHQLIGHKKRPLMICGVKIDSELALEGHSDADVGLHALVDALLGAVGEGDIGEHFSPKDSRWKDCDSSAFVAEAVRLVKANQATIVNADMTIIAQTPRLESYKAAMHMRVAELLSVDHSRVNIKATTTEGLGFIGRKEGIAAQAVVSVKVRA